jgi:hypothetical protein
MSEYIERRIREIQDQAKNSFDSFHRPAKAEENINITCRNVLNSPDGENLMTYLRSITTDAVMHPSCTDAELRMQEGMRRLVGILDARRKSKPKLNS